MSITSCPPTHPFRRANANISRFVALCRAWGFVRSCTSWRNSLGLTGYVFNSSSGVTIEIEGGERGDRRISQDPERRSSAARGNHRDHGLRSRSSRAALAFPFLAAGTRRANLRWSLPTQARATLAGAILGTLPIGAMAIPSPTAPIAARATPSSATYLMTARRPRMSSLHYVRRVPGGVRGPRGPALSCPAERMRGLRTLIAAGERIRQCVECGRGAGRSRSRLPGELLVRR